MSIKRQFYFNALFDVELGGFSTTALKQSAAEMTTLFLPLSAANDTVHLDVDIHDTFLDYLHYYHFKEQSEALTSIFSNLNNCIVWGWNQQVIEKLMLIDGNLFPSLETVKEVNGRQFCSKLCEKYGLGVPNSYFCTTEKEVKSIVYATEQNFPLLLKANYGNAGFGIRVLNHSAQMKNQNGLIKHHLSCGGLVIEPYYERITDLTTAVIVGRDGNCGPIYYQQQQVNRHGAYYANYCSDGDDVINRWKEELKRVSLLLGRAIAAKGYFGPVGIDFFVYYDRFGKERLASAIDINARFTMGLMAQMLRKCFAPGKEILFRFISKKKCCLPETISAWKELCGSNHFSEKNRSGILLLNPPRIRFKDRWTQPQRSAFLLAADSKKQLKSLDRELRTFLSRKR